MFPDKPGIMKSREFVAQDVVANHNRMDKSPKKTPTILDHIVKVEATDKHTVVYTFKNLLRRVDLPVRLGLQLEHRAPGDLRCPRQWRQGLEEPRRYLPRSS